MTAMPERNDFRVLVATDGSTHARAAVATARTFPWPSNTRVRAVVACRSRWSGLRRPAIDALGGHFQRVAAGARRLLRRTWPNADATAVDGLPVDAILGEARRFRANLIALGWRGYGPMARLLMGSVSRGVVRRAFCPVLVVRRRRDIRTVVVGVDGSPNARKAARFLASLKPPRSTRVILVYIVEPVTVPSAGLLPGTVRTVLAREATKVNAERLRHGERELRAIAPRLKRAGWRVSTRVRLDVPLRGLLEVVKASKADLVCLGARGTGGVKRLLLGSVAEGALDRCPVGILLVR
jgi:nucleotide-binding universal stress UspA family protein